MERLNLPRDAHQLLIQIGLTVEGLVLQRARELVGGESRPVCEWDVELIQKSLKTLLADDAHRLMAELQKIAQGDEASQKQAA